MGKYDISMKNYFMQNDRVACICNYCVGEKLFGADDIKELQGYYASRDGDGKFTFVQRDILRKVLINGEELLIGIENQQNINRTFPIRQMEMDCLEYKRNLQEIQKKNRSLGKYQKEDDYLYAIKKTDRILPIITLVLYWGEEEWDAPQKLSDIQNLKEMPDKVRALLNEYRIHIIHMRNIPDEELEEMDSDLRYVVGILKCSRDKERYQQYIMKNKEFFSCIPRSAIDVIDACVNMGVLRELMKYVQITEGQEVANMCQALDDLVQDSKKEGIIQGEERVAKLNLLLIGSQRFEELERASRDSVFRSQLYQQYGI